MKQNQQHCELRKYFIFTRNHSINNFIKIIFLFFFLSANNNGYAQSVAMLELQIKDLNNQLMSEYHKYDSLKSIYNQHIRDIDQQKKNNADQNVIKKMMASSVVISNKIEDQQKRIKQFEIDLNKKKEKLESKYLVLIDSLKELQNSKHYTGNKENLEKEILTFTEKKILISPTVTSLSYNPEKIISLNPGDAKSNEERKIYSEYLSEALKETENKLQQVQSINGEVKQIVQLQKKTKKFLEEVELGSTFNRSALAVSGKKNVHGTEATNTPNYDSGERDITQLNTYLYILNQLDFKIQPDINSKGSNSIESKDKNLTYQEYSELLSEVEKRLAEYRLVLKNKINSFK